MSAPPKVVFKPFNTNIQPALDYKVSMVDGVGVLSAKSERSDSPTDPLLGPPPFSKEEFVEDWNKVFAISVHGPMYVQYMCVFLYMTV